MSVSYGLARYCIMKAPQTIWDVFAGQTDLYALWFSSVVSEKVMSE